jgi:mono/diheme cytochrome c family protein
MRTLGLFAALTFAGAIAVACGDANTNSLAYGGPGAGYGSGPGSANGGSSGGSSGTLPDGATDPGDAGTSLDADPTAISGNSGLPCDVQKVLEDGCIACHGGNQSPRMLSYADLTAPSPQYPGQTVAQRSLARMQAGTMPPAPATAATSAEIATFQAWVNAGTPQGTQCNAPAGGADAGAPSTNNNYNTAVVCTSGKTWAPPPPPADGTGSTMDPGQACIACHQMKGGPRFAVAGTVYPTAHEPDMCEGVSSGALTVVITDKNGTVVNLKVGSTGNFESQNPRPDSGVAPLVPPFTAKVTNGTTMRAMAGAITAGDCNSCHTESGANGAPGRIMAP